MGAALEALKDGAYLRSQWGRRQASPKSWVRTLTVEALKDGAARSADRKRAAPKDSTQSGAGGGGS